MLAENSYDLLVEDCPHLVTEQDYAFAGSRFRTICAA